MREPITGPTLWPFSYLTGEMLAVLLAVIVAQTVFQVALLLGAALLFAALHRDWLHRTADERAEMFRNRNS